MRAPVPPPGLSRVVASFIDPRVPLIGHTRHGLPDLRWHDLRHTAVSFMVAAGLEPLVFSRALGHGSISITHDVHGHILPSTEDALGDAMDRVYTAAMERDGR